MTFFKSKNQGHSDVALGLIKKSLFKKEKLTESELNHHVHIVGASGFGKTVLLSHILKNKITAGHGLLYVDLKGDIDTISKIQDLARAAGREQDLEFFSLSNQKISVPYNLIQGGTATQLRDKILLSLTWSEEYYKNQSSSYLLKLLIGLCYLRDETNFMFHLGTVLKACEDPKYVVELSEKVPSENRRIKEVFESSFNFLQEKENYKSLQGLRTQLESLVLSDFGDLLCPEHTDEMPKQENEELGPEIRAELLPQRDLLRSSVGRSSVTMDPSPITAPRYQRHSRLMPLSVAEKRVNQNRGKLESGRREDDDEKLNSSRNECGINLFKSVTEGKITCIFLDSRRYGESAKAVGKFLLQDLKMVSAKIDSEIPKSERKNFVCVIDEFADLAQEDFIGFLDRARSSKMAIVVAHQELSDLNRISPEFAGRLMGNTSTLYAFLQKRPESAELISGIAGTKKVWKETMRSQKILWFDFPTGDKSLREVEEFNIHPNVVKSLRVGECIAVKKYPYARAHLVRVHRE